MGCPPGSHLPGALQTLWYLADPTGFLTGQAGRHGATFRVRTLMYGEQVFVSDPSDLAQAFAADPDVLRAGEANTVLRRVVGPRSVSSLDGDAHRARRRLLGPALQAAPPPDEHLRSLALAALRSLPTGRPTPLRPALRRLTLDAMLATLFGSAADTDGLGPAFARLVDRGSVPFAQLGVIPWLQRDLGPLSPWHAFAADLGRVDDALRARIARRRRSPPRRLASSAPAGLLDALLVGRDEHGHSLSDADLRDDLFTLLGAGHETTATAIGWALEAILARPALGAQIRRELGDDPDGSPTLEASLREVLRLYPVLPTVTRRLAAPFALGRHALAAGTDVVLCLYLAQRSARHYAHPDEFRPEHFLGSRPAARPWWPFGGGSHRCPGLGLALRLLRLTVATALTDVDLSLAHPGPSEPVFRGATLAPAGGVRVVRTA